MPQRDHSWHSNGALLSAGLAGMTFLWFGWLAQFGWDPHHDGIITKPAIDVANGARVFADTFSQYGAVMIWLQAGVVSLFGESLLAIRLSAVVFLAVSVFFLLLCLRRVLPGHVALGAVLLWLVMNDAHTHVTLPWSSVYLMGVQGIVLYLTLLCFEARTAKPLLWLAIGALVGLVLFIRLPQGLVHMLAFTLALLLSPLVRPDLFRFRANLAALLALFAGFAGVVGAVLYVITRIGSYDDFVLQMFEMARAFPKMTALAWHGQEGSTGALLRSAFNALFPRTHELLWLAFALATVLAFLWLVAPKRRVAPYGDWPALLAFTTVAAASWSQYFPIAEPRHFYWAAMPMVGPFAIMCFHLAQRWLPKRFAALATLVFFALFLVNTLPERIGIVSKRVATHSMPIEDSPRLLRGLSFPPEQHAEITELADTLSRLRQRFPERPVIVTGFDPIYVNFVESMPNWHPVYVSYDIALAVYPQHQRQLADFIQNEVPILVTNGEVPLHLGYRPALSTFDGLTVAEPGGDPAQAIAQYSIFGPPAQGLRVERDLLFNQAHWVPGVRNPAAFRTAPLDLDQDFLLEVALQTAFGMREYETILFSLFGQDQGYGLTVSSGADPDSLLVTFRGQTGEAVVPLELAQRSFAHLAIQRIGAKISVWLDGELMGSVDAPEAMGSRLNPLIIGSSIRMRDLSNGKVFGLRVQTGAAGDQIVRNSNAHVQSVFDGFTLSRMTLTQEEDE